MTHSMKVAALYDVHGNLPALKAVLAEVEAMDVDLIVFGGDLVWGPWPSETLQCAQSLGSRARFLHGNCETLVLDGATPEYRWARDRLSAEQRAIAAVWPSTLSIDIDGLGPTLFCHATPRSEEEILTPDASPARWREALSGMTERILVCGHTHLQFDRSLAGVRVVNPGSIGAPTVRPAAWWAVLGPEVELKVTEYDTEAALAEARAVMPDSQGLEYWLRHPPSYEDRVAALTALS